jgi:predicted outer membrane protein
MREGALVCGLLVALLGASAHARTTVADRAFLGTASREVAAELRLAELAIQRGVAPEVKADGRRVLEDLKRLDRELAALTRDRGLPPAELDPRARAELSRLQQLPRDEFDRAYLKIAEARRRRSVDLLESQAGLGSDGALRVWAGRNAMLMRAHHDLAEDARQNL